MKLKFKINKDFKGHAGRKGQVGGSLPRGGGGSHENLMNQVRTARAHKDREIITMFESTGWKHRSNDSAGYMRFSKKTSVGNTVHVSTTPKRDIFHVKFGNSSPGTGYNRDFRGADDALDYANTLVDSDK
jgi:hypothetical protein